MAKSSGGVRNYTIKRGKTLTVSEKLSVIDDKSIISKKSITMRSGRTYEYDVASRMPEGWKINKGATTAPNGYTWIDNGKSLFDGEYRHALIKTNKLKRRR